MTRQRALLLDVDRTLVDLQSFTDYAAAVVDVERELGDLELAEVPETDWGSVTQRAMAILVSLAGDPPLWQRASNLIEAHEAAAVPQAVAMPGLDDLLARTSGMPRALATLIGPGALDDVAARFGIDVRIRVGRRADLRPKPAADQLLAACAELGVSPADAVFVGDSSWDAAAAIAAGTGFIGVTNGAPSQFPPDAVVVRDLAGALELVV